MHDTQTFTLNKLGENSLSVMFDDYAVDEMSKALLMLFRDLYPENIKRDSFPIIMI